VFSHRIAENNVVLVFLDSLLLGLNESLHAGSVSLSPWHLITVLQHFVMGYLWNDEMTAEHERTKEMMAWWCKVCSKQGVKYHRPFKFCHNLSGAHTWDHDSLGGATSQALIHVMNRLALMFYFCWCVQIVIWVCCGPWKQDAHTNRTFILKKLWLGLPANSALLNFFGFGTFV
jgi:hypothetical protein